MVFQVVGFHSFMPSLFYSLTAGPNFGVHLTSCPYCASHFAFHKWFNSVFNLKAWPFGLRPIRCRWFNSVAVPTIVLLRMTLNGKMGTMICR